MARSMALAITALLMTCRTAWSGWESMGPEGGEVRHILESPLDPDVVYFFSDGYDARVFRSTDAGASWACVGSFDNLELGADIGADGTLYAGGTGAFYRSADDGATWASSTVPGVTFGGVAVHPAQPGTILASGSKQSGSSWNLCFLRSTDDGITWTTVVLGASNSFGTCIAVSPLNPQVIFAGGKEYFSGYYQPAVYRSTDGGATWAEVTPSGCYYEQIANSIAVSPADQNTVLLGTWRNIYRSTNCGTGWMKVTNYQYSNFETTFSSATASLAISGGDSCVNRSTDAGLTWTSHSTGLPAFTFTTVEPSRHSSSVAYAGCHAGIWKSASGGTSWSESNSGLSLGSVLACGIAPSQPSRLYVQLEALGLWRTDDAGQTWTELQSPLDCGDFYAIAVKPDDPLFVLALEGSG